ncbi:MAG: PTS system mannose/fructose/sorbose family transporter subunit IID [Chloroflexi bacterium]|nr:PTS system mannose/fructose/sorbose family transporter subunit IID [Chloroflexota bacterium]
MTSARAIAAVCCREALAYRLQRLNMTITPLQALLIGLTYFAANTSFLGGLGYFTTWRPLVNGLIVGLILGDPLRGATVGALINVLYLGYLSVGGTLGIGDAALAGILGATAGVIASHGNLAQPVYAIGLGVITGVLLGNLGFSLLSLRMSLDNRLVHRMDLAAERGDARTVVLLNVVAGQALLLALTVPSAAVLAWVLPAIVNAVTSLAPDWVLKGIGLAGTGMSGALGIALAMRFVFKARGIALFFAGFGVVAVLNISETWFTLSNLRLNINVIWIAIVLAAMALVGLRYLIPLASFALTFRRHRTGATFPLWQFFSHSSYSFERLQGSGFACALASAIQRLYPRVEDRAAAMQRHLAFFNAEPNWGSIILGITLRMEEQHAAGRMNAESIPATKQSLMGVISGFGDSISQGAILPLVLSIALAISLSPSETLPWQAFNSAFLGPVHGEPAFPVIAVIVYLLMICPLMLAISYLSFHVGYQSGHEAVITLLGHRTLKRWEAIALQLGAFTLGALAATPTITGLRLHIIAGAAGQVFELATPLALVLLFYMLVQRFQVRPAFILAGIIISSLLLSLAGII